ncbi:hypothetical protein B0H11DRAFT_1934425 [Mycena galericulata]|nr:hypothetical protein B0H11DRAFT_1934425 [Mycena galericulata]
MTEQKLQCQDLMDKLLPLYIDITHVLNKVGLAWRSLHQLKPALNKLMTENILVHWDLHQLNLVTASTQPCPISGKILQYITTGIGRTQDAKYYNLTEVHQLKLSL